MFKFMQYRASAIENGIVFAADRLPDMSSSTVKNMIPAYNKFPCLIEWFVNIDWRNNPTLDYNIYRKSDAKCLVYPHTNKSNALSQIVLRSDVGIRKAIRRSGFMPVGWNKADIRKAGGFNEVLKDRKTPDEPFFVKIRVIRKDRGNNNHIRISVINLKMAKHLVYYHKNNMKSFWGKEITVGISDLSEQDVVEAVKSSLFELEVAEEDIEAGEDVEVAEVVDAGIEEVGPQVRIRIAQSIAQKMGR